MPEDKDPARREMPWDRDMKTSVPIKIIVIAMTLIFIALVLATCASLVNSPIR